MLKTKWGLAKISQKGYYRITRPIKKEYFDKLLHRLIFEDFYKIKLPSNIHIHHVDEDKTNNEIWNLIPMTKSEHISHHRSGKPMANPTKQKISKTISGLRNTSGCYRVCKQISKEMNQGYFWKYRYISEGKRKSLGSADLNKLKKKVIDNGLEWKVLDEEMAKANGLIIDSDDDLTGLPIVHVTTGLWSPITW